MWGWAQPGEAGCAQGTSSEDEGDEIGRHNQEHAPQEQEATGQYCFERERDPQHSEHLQR